MSVIINRLKLRWNADSRIEPLEGVAPVSPVTQRWMVSMKHLVGRVSSVILGPDAVFHGILLVAYALLATWGILHHAMWRDELQAWLVAVDSRSLGELLTNLRLETHPFLWHLLLYGLSRFTANPIAMQLLHLGLAVATIWVFLRFSPFRRVEKALFIFGYFPLYEYCLISRDYVLVFLLIFVFCALLQNRPLRYIPIAAVLFCLTNSHMYGFVLASALVVFLIYLHVAGYGDTRASLERWKLVAAISLTLLGFALILWKCFLIPRSKWEHSLTAAQFAQSLSTIWYGYVPLPNPFPYWPTFGWGANFLDVGIGAPPVVLCVLSAALVLGVAGLLLDRPKGFLLYALITVFVLLFQFVVYCGPLRCAGILFIVLIAVFWLSASTFETKTYSGRLGKVCEKIPNWRRTFLIVLLSIHLAAGLYAYSAERAHSFSASRDAAQFLRRQGLAQAPIVASPEIITQGLAAYLQRPIYYADSSRWGSHCPFQQVEPASADKIIQCAYQLSEEKGEDVVLALNQQLMAMLNGVRTPVSEMYSGPKGPYLGANGIILTPSEVRLLPLPRVKIRKLAQFDKVITDEPYFLYVLTLER
jgi:hypothetical protein